MIIIFTTQYVSNISLSNGFLLFFLLVEQKQYQLLLVQVLHITYKYYWKLRFKLGLQIDVFEFNVT